MILPPVGSVSYTHLDVYKRQAIDGGFSFCLFFDQVSVVVIDILYFVSGLRVFLGNYLVVFIVGDGDGSVPIGMSALIDLTETS